MASPSHSVLIVSDAPAHPLHADGFPNTAMHCTVPPLQAQWSITPASGKRCVVIVQRDPLPAGFSARMSFGNFNPDTEALQAAAAAAAKGGAAGRGAAAASAGKDSSDEEDVAVSKIEMARGWGKGSSLRMNAQKSKKARHR